MIGEENRLKKIRKAFEEYFGNPLDEVLSKRLRTDEVGEIDHVINRDLWGGSYRLYFENDEYYLDFYAYSNHTNSRHMRVLESGETIALENYWEFGYVVYEDDPERTEREKNEQIEKNRIVEEILKSKGFK